jgi:5-formyltetrahydrofolate cyclo-ligase
LTILESTPGAEKSALRKRILAARDALDPAARRDFSSRITPRILALPAYRDARCVMAYVSFGAEFDTGAVLADLRARGKQLVLPRVDRKARALKLHAVRDPGVELAPGVWGIPEPRVDVCPEVAPVTIDFVLIPGVAFTARCDRLGYGGGFYDRLIPAFEGRPALVAAAYSIQIVPELPVTPSDQSVNLVLTEDAGYSFPGTAGKGQA